MTSTDGNHSLCFESFTNSHEQFHCDTGALSILATQYLGFFGSEIHSCNMLRKNYLTCRIRRMSINHQSPVQSWSSVIQIEIWTVTNFFNQVKIYFGDVECGISSFGV